MKPLEEVLNYAEQERKMDAWHNGARGANIASMSSEKAKMNYEICIKKHYTKEADEILKVAFRNAFSWAVIEHEKKLVEKNSLTVDDFNSEDCRIILSRLELYKSGDYTPIPQIVGYGSVIKDLTISLIWLIVLGAQDLADRLKDRLVPFYISLESLKIIINNALSNDEILKRISTILADPSAEITEDLNLNEKVEKHDTLNPKLWNEDNTLKPEVGEKINQIVQEFVDGLAEDEIKIDVDDIVIIGSNCSYNYNEGSDLDVHIRANTDTLDCPEKHLDKLYSAYRSLFNKKFDIDFYGIPVELYVETGDLNTISNGVYSVKNKQWIKEPVQADIPEVDEEAINEQVGEWTSKYNDLLAAIGK